MAQDRSEAKERGWNTTVFVRKVSNAAVACDKVLFSKPVMPWRGQTNGEQWFLQGLKERRVREDKMGPIQELKDKKI